MRRAGFVIVALLCVCPIALAREPAVSLDVSVGFGGLYRAGAWSPVFLTLASKSPRAVLIEIALPHDQSYTMSIAQQASIGPEPTAFQLLAPLPMDLSRGTVTIRDGGSWRALADAPLEPTIAPQNLNSVGGGSGDIHVGFSGTTIPPAVQLGNLRTGGVRVGDVPPGRLPAAAVGYQSLDVLILGAVDLARLDATVQQAIADWVYAGGQLVLWPGAAPLPARSPIVDLLPVEVGENTIALVDEATRKDFALPPRFEKLPVRSLARRDGATESAVLGDSVKSAWIDRGLGRAMALPVDPTLLAFDSSVGRERFWRAVFAPLLPAGRLIEAEESKSSAPVYYNYNYYEQPEWTMAQATSGIIDEIGNVPGMGRFGFSYVLIVLLGLMFVVGPVDWFVLKWMGRQPWTIATTTGWIALITLASVYIGSLVRSGDLHLRTMQLVEQADGRVVSKTTLAVIYSPRSQRYELATPPESWWRPAATQYTPYDRGGLTAKVPFHQTRGGNLPASMPIPVWSMRLLRGDEIARQPAWIGGDLKLLWRGDEGRLVGSLTNSGPELRDVTISTRLGSARLADGIAAGATLEIDAPISPRTDWAVTPLRTYAYDHNAEQTQDLRSRNYAPWGRFFSANITQDDRMRQRLHRDEARPVAVIVGVTPTVEESEFSIEGQQPRREHRRALRAMLPIRIENQP